MTGETADPGKRLLGAGRRVSSSRGSGTRVSCFRTPHRGAWSSPLCNQGAQRTPPTTSVLMGSSRARAQGHVQSRPLCSALGGTREEPGKAPGSGSPGRTDRRGGVCGRDCAVRKALGCSQLQKPEKLITLLDGKALRGEEPVSSQNNI